MWVAGRGRPWVVDGRLARAAGVTVGYCTVGMCGA
jgi:hypothetical protein